MDVRIEGETIHHSPLTLYGLMVPFLSFPSVSEEQKNA